MIEVIKEQSLENRDVVRIGNESTRQILESMCSSPEAIDRETIAYLAGVCSDGVGYDSFEHRG
jgi:hypothetical protein